MTPQRYVTLVYLIQSNTNTMISIIYTYIIIIMGWLGLAVPQLHTKFTFMLFFHLLFEKWDTRLQKNLRITVFLSLFGDVIYPRKVKKMGMGIAILYRYNMWSKNSRWVRNLPQSLYERVQKVKKYWEEKKNYKRILITWWYHHFYLNWPRISLNKLTYLCIISLLHKCSLFTCL